RLTIFLFVSFNIYSTLFADSCKDIYLSGNTINGTYQIYNRKNQGFSVYCEFHNNYGYTFISKKANVEININDLYTTREHVKIRIEKNDRTQAETIVENLARYKTQYPLGLFYNRNNGYATPINHAVLGPYLYLGFLPISAANHVQPQGYRAGGRDFPFNNCDHNPNSYIAFYFNPNSHKENQYSDNEPLMHQWINVARNIPTSSYMSDDYYFMYEMHMGGCGGYAFAHHYDNLLGASLGLRFGKVFQQIVGISIGTNCAPLLGDIFLYSYEAEFIQSLVSGGKRYLASDFNFTCRYIDDVLSINNPKFADYLSSIYPSELEVKENTETNYSASYLDIMLSYDTDGHMNTSLHDKSDDFNFSIRNIPFLSSNIPSSPAYGVFISQLIRYARASTKYTDFVPSARRLSDKLLSQGYLCDRLTSSLRKFYVRYGELVIQYDVPLSRMVDDILS
ncbi:hypothetical protein FSP39_004850, partial [Pinctada imbricata]